ncbi:helix-turn-helix domain-containing protein [Mucilaginibacter lacusdianchii]|uniref:helix-turn-helix domain-containing protein n=1 Tax=Mucilaginibacter lacusdianchii TaxID=2684211 RepID=UPI00131B07B6|nr:helix-turn-helix domain-containing protein [Mucilaginibacter sp. JXJ CY 39]
MAATETLEEFYQYKFNWMPSDLKKDIGHFNVFNLDETYRHGRSTVKYSRWDFYKIMLIRGRHVFHYADKSLEVNGSNLIFFNPLVPYKFERITADPSGYFCIFKEAFFAGQTRNSVKDLPMFVPGAKAVFALDPMQDEHLTSIFYKMQSELQTDYLYKYDLIRGYMMEIVHQALKMQPTETLHQHADANTRLTAVFTDLLERQFPIESVSQQFKMRSASAFAEQMNVHVNHLNRAIRLTTGKTTTELIFERMVAEAKALLEHTSWNIAEISYCLGFEEPSHFNHFFKKLTHTTPTAFR